ncbi:MAG: relaxase/mobilization nuclease domain-containing protein, partial [Oscillospiraceae bacterium]|nr:relaxase/mobilization nuclease domain-containing protein [Oscillospiraceae bacterium]
MATTSLWRVKGDLGRVIDYAGNELKTSNPDYIKTQDTESESERWLTDVIKYAVQDHKTTCSDENNEVMKKFVSGINCTPDTARAEMMATKRQFTKTGGIIAYHGYLSFAPGEATPEIAHKIGVKLATQLWGSRHEVIVTTHLDKINHLHCHFVINTVSFVDGKKFHRTKKDYYEMQKASDALCREYGLSVIENPKRGKSKHYSEWNAERNGQPTYRS